MRRFIGIACIALGVLCICTAVGLVIYNHMEEQSADEFSKFLLQDVQEEIIANMQQLMENTKEQEDYAPNQEKPSEPEIGAPNQSVESEEVIPEEVIVPEMKTIEIGGYGYIGILSIPSLGLELPVMTDWSYAKLKKAPCHYYGSCYESDFVIAAHNYKSHFGRLSKLQQGDPILFTDAVGQVHRYEVVLLETLPKTATLEMITSGFDLSLYTCTLGGASRVTVRCQAAVG